MMRISSATKAMSLNNLFRRNAIDNRNFILQILVRKFTPKASEQLEEESYSTEITSLPHHLQPFAYQKSDSILSSFSKNFIPYNETVGLLKALRVQIHLKNTSYDNIKDDIRFRTLSSIFVQGCDKLYPAQLVSGLRSLLEIGVSPDSTFISNLNKIISTKLDTFDITQLISCLHLYHKHLNTEIQIELLPKLLQLVQNRLSEISLPAEGLMLIQMLHLFGRDATKAIQQKLIEIISYMDTQDLIRVMSIISERGQRNKVLLNAVSKHLTQQNTKPNMKDTIKVLHSINSLSFFDQDLLLYLTESRKLEIALIKLPSLIATLLTVCGQLKWKHQEILEACGDWIVNNSKSCTSRELIAFVLTAAALNYIPKNTAVIQRMTSFPMSDDTISSYVWLDIVWSLAILKQLDKSMLMKVLSPEFHKPLLSTNTQIINNNLKLMNLKYILKMSNPEYVFSCDLFLEAQQITRSKESDMCRKEVLDSLSNLVPENKFMATNLHTDMGITIDAEFVINKKGKPLSLDIYGLKAKPTVVSKSLPTGAKRIALMIWLFRDYTLNEKTLTGANALAVRILTAQGYEVIQVPYEEFVQRPTEVKKVVYLSQLINEVKTEKNGK